MSLVSISYFEYQNQPKHWEISDATFSDINLVVGKNSSGKSRLISVISGLSRIIAGLQPPVFDSSNFTALIELSGREFLYKLFSEQYRVTHESLHIDGKEMLDRGPEGAGKIWYEDEKRYLTFKLPTEVAATVNRRDEIQHPYLMELNQWANGVVKYAFGSEFGKTQLLDLADIFQSSSPNNAQFGDPDNLVKVYSTAYQQYGDAFDKAIIDDMNSIGYALTAVGLSNIQEIMKFPVSAGTLYTVETDLGFKIPQSSLSQGMYRALALIIHLNVCAFAKHKQLILIDDIGEGLDYERSTAIIDVLIAKANEHHLQIIMTSNDRFVMNHVPLEYWSVLRRTGGTVKLFNKQNSSQQFERFEYVGLNNFDFFASNFFDAEVEDD